MKNSGKKYEEVIQNLKDAGCSQAQIQKFVKCLEDESKKEQLAFLDGHRNDLLDRVHSDEKRIECLDYLIYQIEQDKLAI